MFKHTRNRFNRWLANSYKSVTNAEKIAGRTLYASVPLQVVNAFNGVSDHKLALGGAGLTLFGLTIANLPVSQSRWARNRAFAAFLYAASGTYAAHDILTDPAAQSDSVEIHQTLRTALPPPAARL